MIQYIQLSKIIELILFGFGLILNPSLEYYDFFFIPWTYPHFICNKVVQMNNFHK